jgi:HK97 family phage major capsid protein
MGTMASFELMEGSGTLDPRPTAIAPVLDYIKRKSADAYLNNVRCALNGVSPDADFSAIAGAPNQSGGYLIPSEIMPAINLREDEFGVARANAWVRRVGATQGHLPIVTGERSFYLIGADEDLNIPNSDQSYSKAALSIKSVAIVVEATRDLDSDSDWFDVSLHDLNLAAAQLEDVLTFSRTGIGNLGGAPGLVELYELPDFAGSVATAGSGETSLATLTAASFRKAVKMLPGRAVKGAKWYIPTSMKDKVLELSDPETTDGDRASGLPFQVGADGVWYVGGFAVEWVAAVSETPSAGDVCGFLGNLRKGVTLASRRALEVKTYPNGTRESLLVKAVWRGDVLFADCGTATKPGAIVALKLAET